MSDDMSAYRDVFLSESAEYLQAMTDGLLALEAEPTDLEPVETVFRGAHSLKGMAAAMGYERTQELTHRMESLMDTVRDRTQTADHSLIDLMLRAIDVVRELIADESSGTASISSEGMVQEVVARTTRAATTPQPVEKAASPEAGGEGALFEVRVTLDAGCVLKGVRAYMAIKRLSHMGTVVETRPDARAIEDEQFDRSFDVVFRSPSAPEAVRTAVLAVTEVEEVAVRQMEEPVASAGEETPTSERRVGSARAVPKLSETQTVRISIGHLDSMVNLVGELVIIRSRLERVAADLDIPELVDALGMLERVSGELQQEVMQTRMVPVGNIFNRFPRMVRDLSRDLGKDVTLVTEGLDIELDRTVLDEIGDPIVHLLRNCVDHGIELPADRVAAGKPAAGTVRLTAEREREQIRITVADDGRGMDVERIWSTAVDRGLVESASRSSYSEHDILLLVCSPGFSTVDKATRVSGRGVGMDVVKGKIEYLGGTITIRTAPGEGTTISLLLPLTLAIIQALLVAGDGHVFAVPLAAVDEVLGLDEVGLRTVENRPVAMLRDGSVVALHRIDELWASGGGSPEMTSKDEHIVVIRSGDQLRALVVPRLIGRREIVIKPLSPLFKGVRGIGGATVLGDGRVALILDPRSLFTTEV
jgi:two-component system chemotaxis sensor kinase CheA